MITLALAEPAYLASIVKPLLMVAVFVPWGMAVSRLDKDAAYYFIKRELFAFAHIFSGILALLAILMIPIFWLGVPLAILLLTGSVAGYIYVRNPQVPDKAKFTFTMDFARQFLAEREAGKAGKKATMRLMNMDESEQPLPIGEDPNVAAHETLETILAWALPRKADEFGVAITGDDAKARVYVQVDGVKYGSRDLGLEGLDKKTSYQLLKYLQAGAKLDSQEKRKQQTGQLKCAAQVSDPETGEVENQRHLFEVVTSGSSRMMSLVVAIDPDQRAHRPLSHMGLARKQQDQLKAALDAPGGVVLVATPPKQGLSTLTYALLNENDPYTSSMITLEEQKMLDIEGVKHITTEPGADATVINKQLAALLRTDPQVMMVDRLVDRETARIVAEAGDEVRFYLPMRGESATDVLQKWIKQVGDPKLAAQSLRAVVSGRLMRIVCETCRTPYKPDAAQLKKMSLPADKINELYRSSGQIQNKSGKLAPCPTCRGLGYRGRTGVYEVMTIDDTARKLVGRHDLERLKAHLASQQYLPLQRAALLKVADGTTDVSEVQRVLSGKDGSRRRKSSSAKPEPAKS